MRQSFLRCSLILLLLTSMAIPAAAAPRRDDSLVTPGGFIERLIEIAKHMVTILDDVKSQVPLP